jgi:hypothetical protein
MHVHTILSLCYADSDSAAPRRRSKRNKLRSRSSPNDGGDVSDSMNRKWTWFGLRFFYC